MRKKPLFQGCATALVTPFQQDGAIDWPSLEQLVERQLAGKVQALVVLGSTGEPLALTAKERRQVVSRVTAQVRRRVPVIVGTGGSSTSAVLEEARMARECGADAQLCVTPYYSRPMPAGLRAHYTALAAADTLPIIVYNVPSRTGVNLSAETMQAICALPQVIGVKEADTDMVQNQRKLALCGADTAFYAGNDELIWPLMACSAVGVISVASNLVPERIAALTEAALHGDCAHAAALQMALQELHAALFCETNPGPIKAALALAGFIQETLRLPLTALQPKHKALLAAVLQGMGLCTEEGNAPCD